MENSIKNINKEILKSIHGKRARVNSGGLYTEGSMEGDCLLNFSDTYGLQMMVTSKWNTTKVSEIVKKSIIRMHLDKIIALSFDDREILIETLQKQIEETYVQSANIYPYNISKIEMDTNEKTSEITNLKIHYKDSIIEIRILR